MLLFDDVADPKDVPTYTIVGGDKLSTNELAIVNDGFSGRLRKAPGNSIWLTRPYSVRATNNNPQPKNLRQHILLHEFCHFVGPREGQPGILDDNAYIQEQRFPFLGKLERLHNASTLALFFQEWCVGHVNVSSLPGLVNPTHFSKFPRVNGATGEIEVGN